VISDSEATRLLRALANQAKNETTCPVAEVGAAFVRSGVVIATGYNRTPRPVETCFEVGCAWVPKGSAGAGRDHARHLHAEADAIATAARNGVELNRTDALVTLAPCPSCALLLIAVGVRSVTFPLAGSVAGWDAVERELVGAGITVRRLAV
jgi:dCMP deaminase